MEKGENRRAGGVRDKRREKLEPRREEERTRKWGRKRRRAEKSSLIN